MLNRELTDQEVDLLVQGFLLNPPFGFTEQERKELLHWMTTPSAFVQAAEQQQKRLEKFS